MSELAQKVDKAKAIIQVAADTGSRPAVLSSFGKDSMVLMHLTKATLKRDPLSTHAFPLPVIYWRGPWFAHKHEFAQRVARQWSMEVHDYMPVAAGIKVNEQHLELVGRYSLGVGYIDIPTNVCRPEEYPRRDYLCGLRDWILRPKSGAITFPWDTLLHGHKSSDVDPFEGQVPLRSDREQIHDNLQLFFPLREWTDLDVWEYLEENHVQFQRQRYGQGRTELEDKWHNNDYTHACTACIDPRVSDPKVFCPKLKSFVPNVGNRVLRLEGLPEYITKVVEKAKLLKGGATAHRGEKSKEMEI